MQFDPETLVRFRAHGETGLVYRVLEREGDDYALKDERGRVMRHVPGELLTLSDDSGDAARGGRPVSGPIKLPIRPVDGFADSELET